MFKIILEAFYLILPAYFANMAPVIFAKLKWLEFLNKPIDGGKKLNNEFILGTNKTWRGLVSGIIFAMIIAGIQAWLYGFQSFYNISLFNYQESYLLFGFLAGFGAIFGDGLKSFFKRRIGIASGKSWPVLDQIDFVFGFWAFTYFIVEPSGWVTFAFFLITLVLHPTINVIAYLLGIKKVWY